MPRLVVVDGSNIATEGRSMPSLIQLNEAVLAFRDEFPDDLITVVVDATFGHRIDPREVAEFDAAVEHNELVTPPAGAIGRGDAFVLSIANKAHATILSNDSFQEFHAQYGWLFDEGRLIGGKPVPHVGWVFVARSPVRGPVSRRAVRDARKPRKAHTTTVLPPPVPATGPLPTPKVPPPGQAKRGSRTGQAAAAVPPAPEPAEPARSGRKGAKAKAPAPVPDAAPATSERQQMVNDLLPFLAFVEAHPVGTEVEVVTESYSSHGAYVTIGDVRGYVPLRLMGDPPPRSAREVLKLGVSVTTVVASFNPGRRSIDLALPGAGVPVAPPAAEAPAPARRSRKKAAPAEPTAEPAEPVAAAPPAPPAKRTRKKAATAPVTTPAAEPLPEEPATEPAAAPAPAPAKRSRKKAAPTVAAPEAPEPAATPTPAPAKAPAAAKRTRKKAAAPTVEPEPEPVPTPAKRTRKKVAAAPAVRPR
jgi:hypothetical protein